MGTFALYLDANLTTPLTGNILAAQNSDGSTAPIQTVIYVGSTEDAVKVQSASNPGVAQIQATVYDNAASTGHAVTEIKLAATQGGLATATPGAALNLGTQILSGVANAKPIWMEIDDATHTVGVSTELRVRVSGLYGDLPA
jgi:hypothetical protein